MKNFTIFIMGSILSIFLFMFLNTDENNLKYNKKTSLVNVISQQVKADYGQDMPSQELIYVYNSIVHLGLDKGLAVHIAKKCNGSKDRSHCFKYAVAVSKAESSLFKRCSYNNCYGVMHRPNGVRRLKKFNTLEDGINDWIRRYKKFRQTRQTPQIWIDRKYCTEHCEHRINNVQYAIDQMNRDYIPIDKVK